MALPVESHVSGQSPDFSSQNPSSSFQFGPNFHFPGQEFLEQYQLWMDNDVTFALPQGEKHVRQDLAGLEQRYNFIISTFNTKAPSADIHGAYGEVMGGMILHTMVQQATNGEYAVIPTPPQLDTTRRRLGKHTAEKTADLVLGKVIQKGGEQVIKPYMLFDVKSYPRGDRTLSNVGTGINVGLTTLPVGLLYLGELEFQDKKGRTRQTWSYLEQVVHPAVLQDKLRLGVLWPDRTKENPQHRLFAAMAHELLLSCQYTLEKIRQQHLPTNLEKELLSNIVEVQKVFSQVQTTYVQKQESAA